MRSLIKARSLILALLILPNAVAADVAPDPGYSNVSADLILESAADLSAYRFFLESPLRVEEVKLNVGSPTVISAAGRGGAARFGTLIAVPVNDLNAISGDLSGAALDDIIRQKRLPNARELLSHNFQTTVSVVEKPVWKAPVYRLSLENGVVTAAKVSGGAGGSWLIYAIPVGVAAVLMAIGIAIVGLWLIRRSRRKV